MLKKIEDIKMREVEDIVVLCALLDGVIKKLVMVIYITILLQSRQQERGEKRNGILHASYIIINTLVMLLSRNLHSGEENNAYNSSEGS